MPPKKHIHTIKIKSNIEDPIPVELIAEHIKQISETMEQALNAGLSSRVIILLIKDQLPNIQILHIRDVLNTIPKLKNIYLKK